MSSLENKQTEAAAATLASDPRWTTDDKHRLAAVLTLAMMASGQDVTPAARREAEAFLERAGVDLSGDPTSVGAAIARAISEHGPSDALSRAADGLVTDDVALRQSARQRRARTRLFDPPKQTAAPLTNASSVKARPWAGFTMNGDK